MCHSPNFPCGAGNLDRPNRVWRPGAGGDYPALRAAWAAEFDALPDDVLADLLVLARTINRRGPG